VFVDIIVVCVFVVLGGILGLIVEAQKHLYPIYLAVALLLAAAALDLLEKAIGPRAPV
jgi:hypothetical protein